MSSFFTGRMPDWGSAATGSAAAGTSADKIKEMRARGAFANEIRGIGSMGDWQNTGDYWKALGQAGSAAWQAYRDAGGSNAGPGRTPFVDRATSLGGYNAKLGSNPPVLTGQVTQPPKVGSPQSMNSSQARAMIAKRFIRRMPVA